MIRKVGQGEPFKPIEPKKDLSRNLLVTSDLTAEAGGEAINGVNWKAAEQTAKAIKRPSTKLPKEGVHKAVMVAARTFPAIGRHLPKKGP